MQIFDAVLLKSVIIVANLLLRSYVMKRSFGVTLLLSLATALFLTALASAQNPEAEKIYQHFKKNIDETSNADCVKQMDQAIALDDKTALYFYQRGLCYLLADDTAKALADVDQAVQLSPNYVEALFTRAHIYDQSNKQKAIADLKHIVEIDPRNAGAYNVLGRIDLDLGLNDDAFAVGGKLIELIPNDSIGYRYQAQSLVHRGHYKDAIPLFSEAIKRADYDVDAYRGRAEAYRKTGNTEAAKNDESRVTFLEQRSGGGMGAGIGAGSGDGKLTNPRLNSDDTDKPVEPTAKIEPIQITKRPRVQYTDEARREKIQGQVVLRVTFKADGTIGPISVIESLPNGLTDKAIEAAKLIEFKPATRNGIPFTVTKTVAYTFETY